MKHTTKNHFSRWAPNRFLRILSFTIAALCMTACTDTASYSLTDLVPANTPCVLSLDLRKIMLDSGCNSIDGKLTPDSVTNVFLDENTYGRQLRPLVDNSGILDLKRVFAYRDSVTHNTIWIAPLNSDTPVEKGSDVLDIPHVGSALVSTTGNGIYSLRTRHYLWVVTATSSKEASQIVASQVLHARKHPLLDNPVYSAVFSHDSLTTSDDSPLIVGVLRHNVSDNALGAPFEAVTIDVSLSSSCSLSIQLNYLNADGYAVDPLSSLKPVSNNFESLLPTGTTAYVAAGLTPETFDAFAHLASHLCTTFGERAALAMISQTLSGINGTMAVACAPGGSAETIKDFSTKTWECIALLPYPTPETAQQKQKALAPVIGRFDDNINLSVQDNTLVASTYKISPYRTLGASRFVDIPDGAVFSARAYIPYRSALMQVLHLDTGLDIYINHFRPAKHPAATVIYCNITGTDTRPAQLAIDLAMRYE